MTTDNIIDLLIIACGGLLVWSIAVTLTLWYERKELTALHKSKEELRESLTKHNYYLRQQLDRMAAEIYDLRTQNHQVRKVQQEQDN